MAINLTDIRWSRHMTKTQLSKESGVSRGTIENIESGRTKNASAKTLLALANALGCKLDDFFAESG